MQWISVEDRLPADGVEVLTCDSTPSHCEFRVDYIVIFPDEEKGYLWASRLVRDCNKVTHWTPLTKPPKEKNEVD